MPNYSSLIVAVIFEEARGTSPRVFLLSQRTRHPGLEPGSCLVQLSGAWGDKVPDRLWRPG